MAPHAKGVHHMAFITRDMEATVQFYTEVMNFPLVVTLHLPKDDPFPGITWGDLSDKKHYFFDCGNGDRIAFFTWSALSEQYAESGAGHHIAFALQTEKELDDARDYLESKGIEVSPVINHFFCKSIYFKDPNGIHLEYSVYLEPCTPEQPFLQDENPVPSAQRILGNKQDQYLLRYAPGSASTGPQAEAEVRAK